MCAAALYGGIEGGGTKFVCAVANSADRIIESVTIPTTDPGATLAECVRFFISAQKQHGPIAAIGFSCFGPIELRRDAASFGCMMQTPKRGWSGVNVLDPLRSTFDVPMAMDTDVGAAAMAELCLGAGQGVGSLAYVTVGTGIGGAVAPSDPGVSRLMHAEMGHLPVRRNARDLNFSGTCPFHGDCLEGLASGLAIHARWGCRLEELPGDHYAWQVIADYLGQLAASIALMHSVERIVFGGGVMSNGILVPHVRKAMLEFLNGYLPPLNDRELAAKYVCAPALGDRAGITGALLLAADAMSSGAAVSR